MEDYLCSGCTGHCKICVQRQDKEVRRHTVDVSVNTSSPTQKKVSASTNNSNVPVNGLRKTS